MQNEKDIAEYWAESTLLKERGWSKGRIAKLLKNPDKLVPNPHYRTAPKMRLYAQSRVLAAEALPEFVTFKTSAPKRAEKAATLRQRQRQLLINRLSCPSVAPLVIYETIVKQRLTPFNESSFPEAFCRDMPEMLWLALSPRPEFEAEAIDIVIRIVLAALDSRAGRHRYNAPGFDQVERIFDIWHAQLDLKTSAGVVNFAYVFTEAIAPNDKEGLRLAERRGYALERLNTISTRKWSVGRSFFQEQIAHDDECFQEQIAHDDEWLFFAD